MATHIEPSRPLLEQSLPPRLTQLWQGIVDVDDVVDADARSVDTDHPPDLESEWDSASDNEDSIPIAPAEDAEDLADRSSASSAGAIGMESS